MIQFEWIWAFAALPLPLLLRFILPAANSQQDAALRVPFIEDFQHISTVSINSTARRWPLLLASLAWACLVIAAARPQWIGEPIELPTSGRDLMLAVDLSGSMDARDFKIQGETVNRLQATQVIAGEFIKRRVGDRVGLILFGEQAYVQTPLTFDRDTVRILLYEAAIGLAGKSTAIGDAIGLMVKRLANKKEEKNDNKSSHKPEKKQQVMILLTDGANTAGEVQPIKAAELAAQKGLKIYTIGIGADEMMVRSIFGTQRINPSADLDEGTLTAIAETTGGKYFRARDSAELLKIYDLIDELEPTEQEAKLFRPLRALYTYPLMTALALSALLILAISLSGLRRQHG
ncbi:MAG: VWA domain-containing protein [Ectothiorhodospiraceae bacterium]|nr:VWA domain-containing protein [Ectothiorhodospiraceae bacterium]